MTLRQVLSVALCVLLALVAQASAHVKPAPFASYNVLNPRATTDRRPTRAQGSLRMNNGNDAAPGQFPHQVAMYIDMAAFCGGALISPKWILTAATCTSSESRPRYTAFLGAQNINLPMERGRKAVTTTASYAHHEFDAETKKNDVALILLPRNVAITDNIKPINLPPPSYKNKNFVGTAFQVSGWGYQSDSAEAISPTLQYVDLQGISAEKCAEVYSWEVVSDDILCCSGQNNQSPCRGDVGGALVFKETDGSLTHVAVASFTSGKGCSLGTPSGFTKTASYVDWIESIVDDISIPS